MNELEKEFLESYNIASDYSSDAMDDWKQEWLKRPEDLDKLVKSDDLEVKKNLAWVGRDKDLDILASDPDPRVRAAVASDGGQPQYLDRLVSDPDSGVRAEAKSKKRYNDGLVTELSAELAKDIKSCESETQDLPTLHLPKYDEYGDYQMVPAGSDDGVISDIYEKYSVKWQKRLDHDHYDFYILAFYAREYQDQQAQAALKALNSFNVHF